MDLEESFVAEIRSNPRDVVPRLVYADYLEESGSPRGELIRVQCELAGETPSRRPRPELQRREAQLLAEMGDTWLEPLRDLGAEGVDIRCFRRGLVERVRIDARRFVEVADELCDVEPALHCLELRGVVDGLSELVHATFPPQIAELELTSNRLEGEHLRAFREASWRKSIYVLDLSFNRLGDEGCTVLNAVGWPALERLHLDSNRIEERGARDLAMAPWLGTLDVLTLNLNRIGDGVEHLARSPHLGTLRRLELASNRIGVRGATAVADGAWFHSIEELVLRNNTLGHDGLLALGRRAEGTSLQRLDVRNCAPLDARGYGERPVFPPILRERLGDALIADDAYTGDSKPTESKP